MGDISTVFRNTLVPIILAAGGLISVLVAAVAPSNVRRVWLGVAGLLLIVLGVLLYAIPAPTCVEEVIQITSPQLGAQVTSPVTITGFGGPAFEGTLQVRVYDPQGELVGHGYATIQTSGLERGPFKGVVEFKVETAQRGQICVSMESPRGAGMADIEHLSCIMDVTLTP
jgi:hypothetical protein